MVLIGSENPSWILHSGNLGDFHNFDGLIERASLHLLLGFAIRVDNESMIVLQCYVFI